MKLGTRYGQFFRGNGGLPPWRNSVTHDIPHRTSTQDWILWDVLVVETLAHSPAPVPVPVPVPAPALVNHSDSFASEPSSPPTTTGSSKDFSFSRQESSDSLVNSLPKLGDVRLIYHIADGFGETEEGTEGLCITFKGNGVDDLKNRLEEETGLEEITVCTRSPLNGKLYPLCLQLPPNNANMNVIILQHHVKRQALLEYQECHCRPNVGSTTRIDAVDECSWIFVSVKMDVI